jgi:hypothetical protein
VPGGVPPLPVRKRSKQIFEEWIRESDGDDLMIRESYSDG